uniref:glutaminase n=1 Tax=uncultured Corynebacterium sp. TaxID=159447 RepID=UPI0025CC4495
MEIPLRSYLDDILDRVRPHNDGAVADYIPELAVADPEPLAVALCTAAGRVYSAGGPDGDDDREFTIQSISKPFAYAVALQEVGVEKVLETVGMEPSGEA